MTNFISSNKHKRTIQVCAIILWLLVWQIGSIYVGQKILLVSPASVMIRISELVLEAEFWKSIWFSFCCIISGFLLAVVLGVILAALSAVFHLIEELLKPLIFVMKSIPVASIIILMLIWVSSKRLSTFVSFLIVLPVIYTNVLHGIQSIDIKLIEMAKLFQIPLYRKIIYIYSPQVMPFFSSACSIGLGLCWKSGTAAEVIGLPDGSIGEKLYQSKIYLATSDLFAWTLTIIVLSVLFERFFMAFLQYLTSELERL